MNREMFQKMLALNGKVIKDVNWSTSQMGDIMSLEICFTDESILRLDTKRKMVLTVGTENNLLSL